MKTFVSLCIFASAGYFSLTPVYTANVPDFVKLCANGDNDCVLEAAREAVPIFAAGIPELGIQSLDPCLIKELIINQNGLVVNISDAVITGLAKSKLRQISLDMEKKELKFGFDTDMEAKSKYEIRGQILVVPINGNGDAVVSIYGYSANQTYPFDIEEKEGGRYIKLKDYTYDYDILGKATFSFSNLFNGNKQLADTTELFLNENWRAVSSEISPPLVKLINKYLASSLKKLFSAVPIDAFVKQ